MAPATVMRVSPFRPCEARARTDEYVECVVVVGIEWGKLEAVLAALALDPVESILVSPEVDAGALTHPCLAFIEPGDFACGVGEQSKPVASPYGDRIEKLADWLRLGHGSGC